MNNSWLTCYRLVTCFGPFEVSRACSEISHSDSNSLWYYSLSSDVLQERLKAACPPRCWYLTTISQHSNHMPSHVHSAYHAHIPTTTLVITFSLLILYVHYIASQRILLQGQLTFTSPLTQKHRWSDPVFREFKITRISTLNVPLLLRSDFSSSIHRAIASYLVPAWITWFIILGGS